MLRVLFALALMLLPLSASAQDVADMAPLPGWSVHPSPHDFDTLVDRTNAAIAANGLAVVTRAGPTGAAANRGIEIPGNMVIGVFNSIFAVRILRLSTPAMIHAPIRLYLTENADGTATLSYILPSTLFAPYLEAAGPDLAAASAELDATFAAIAETATTR
jgi:uncharacterized protein (DUF302 family)